MTVTHIRVLVAVGAMTALRNDRPLVKRRFFLAVNTVYQRPCEH